MPPGDRLEALKGSRKGQHSIRINDQWRICFRWETDGPHQVEIVKGRRSITADTALRFSRYFAWPAEVWLNLQSQYDRQVTEAQMRPVLARIKPCGLAA